MLMLLLYAAFGKAQGLLLDGFMQQKGTLVSAVSYSYEQYNTYYVGGEATKNPNLGTISTNSVSLYMVGGITDYLNIVANLPYVSTKPSEGYWSPQSDIQDLSIFLRGRLLNKDLADFGKLSVMLAAGYSIPLSDYIPDAPIAIGHQTSRAEFRLVVQHQFPIGIFIMAQGGYIRNNNVTIDRGYEVSVPDATDLTLRVGGNIRDLYVDGWLNRQNARSGNNIGPGVPFPTNAISFLRSGFNLYYGIPKVRNLGLSAGMAFTLTGENVGKSTRVSTGIVYTLALIK